MMASGGPGPVPGLRFVASPDLAWLRAFLPVTGPVEIGRNAEEAGGARVADVNMSRRHARVVPDPDGLLRVVDLGSRNGTFVEGVRIGEEGHALPAGACLRLGDTVAVAVDPTAPPSKLLAEIRKEDTPALFEGYLRACFRGAGPLRPNACEALILAAWPEGRASLKRAAAEVALGLRPAEAIGIAHLACAGISPPRPLPERKPRPKRRTDRPSAEDLRAVLLQTSGSVRAAAALLGTHRRQLYRWLHHHGVDPEAFRQGKPPGLGP